jgi:hypothetical protein
MDDGRTNVTVDILVDSYIAWDDSHPSSPHCPVIRLQSEPWLNAVSIWYGGLLGWGRQGKPYRHRCRRYV